MENTIFGIRPVLEAIRSGRDFEKIYFRKGVESRLLAELIETARKSGINVQEVPVEKLDRLVRGNHQGVVAKIAVIEYAQLNDIMEGIPQGEIPLILVLDGITDVRNFGAIARSAECAGVHGIVTSLKNGAPVNADAIRTSAGALARIPVCRVGSLRNALKSLQSAGIQLVGATEKSDTVLFDADLQKPTAIIMGSEETGISKEVLKICDIRAAIPTSGEVESLNVSAAAAVILFEAVRQRKYAKSCKPKP